MRVSDIDRIMYCVDGVHVCTQYGMTPLMLAINKRREQIINVLIHAGVDVNAKSNDVSLI